MTKKELRKLYRQKRMPLDVASMHQLIAGMLVQFQKIHLPAIHYLLSFKASSAKLEVPVHFFETFLLDENSNLAICYPRADFETYSMDIYEDNESLYWEETPFGIEQPRKGDLVMPAQIDCVLVPLLAFDKQGNRVGYGKGFYDRLLPKCRPEVPRIGVSFFEAELLISDAGEYDVPLTHCVTPQQLYVF